jgi:carboxylate-amine ligase
LLDYVRPQLAASGDWELMEGLTEAVRRGGTSADRQRRVLAESGHLEDVVDQLASETATP